VLVRGAAMERPKYQSAKLSGKVSSKKLLGKASSKSQSAMEYLMT
jgi:hypothetical protein